MTEPQEDARMTEEMEQETKGVVVNVGIDVGTESSKAVLGEQWDYELVRNAHGGHTTPTAITFHTNWRGIGEDAATTAGPRTITHVNRRVLLLSSTSDNEDALDAFCPFDVQKQTGDVEIADYNGKESQRMKAPALLGMVLGKLGRSIDATVSRLTPHSTSLPKFRYALAVPPGISSHVKDAVMDAAYAAGGWEEADVDLVDVPDCLAAVYGRKFATEPERQNKIVLVVDMGHATTCVSVLRLQTNENEEGKEESKTEVLACGHDACLGAGMVDARLWHHFKNTLFSNSSLAPNSKKGLRLLQGCRKLKHVLSMLPTGSVTVENIVKDDTETKLTASADLMTTLCEAELTSLRSLMERVMKEAQIDTNDDSAIGFVEVLGGGCRIPSVQETIRTTSHHQVLSHSLDDTCISLGAAMVGGSSNERTISAVDPARLERRNQLRAAEIEMANLDDAMAKRSEARNELEAHVLELRSARHSKHGSLLPDDSILDPFLTEVDDWIFSDECDHATLAEMEAKVKDVMERSNELCRGYLEAVQAEARQTEKEMEEEAAKAAAERQNDDGDEDHDTRRLPKKRRMEIVMKNKAEANELFQDGNYRHAAARYAKALSHCSKFYDLSPNDDAEVKAVQLTLHLNMALAYTKLEQPDHALRCCNDALAIDENSVKALFRRATIYFSKKWYDQAAQDLKMAAKLAPDDKAIPKLQAKLDRQFKVQKAKEKKLAQKMFG